VAQRIAEAQATEAVHEEGGIACLLAKKARKGKLSKKTKRDFLHWSMIPQRELKLELLVKLRKQKLPTH
jgi:hypothetical protein